MKTGIHPEVHADAKTTCASCGAVFEIPSVTEGGDRRSNRSIPQEDGCRKEGREIIRLVYNLRAIGFFERVY